ncbi:MAG: site-specific integrase [Candidatus Hydrogenedentes bacterium]|nr:site-specific integrase [Candidatus Hydrogenedentota bacterium]
MAKVRARKETGTLYLDFFYRGKRCREQTALPETPSNRKKLEKILERIEFEIKLGTFDYAKFFPSSHMAAKFAVGQAAPSMPESSPAVLVAARADVALTKSVILPTFKEFAATWVAENEVTWRRSNRRTIDDILRAHLLPAFGEKVVGQITKADILAFRSTLAKVPGRKAETLSAKRINAIMAPLRQILNEAADRFDFNTPYRNIKALKLQKSDVEPFSLAEVRQILATVRADYRDYYTVRFFTGMRTGEIDGLKWQYVDFERRLILVRETLVAGEEDYTKTDGSQREIQMSEAVFQALQNQSRASRGRSPFVFCTREGNPLDHNNVTKRVWYPLLRYLGLRPRRPYQTRHTAATLWLAAGENPQWIARQLGHSSTEMLFKVYARFVPNLTRQDGSAFERLLLQSGAMPAGQNSIAACEATTTNPEEAHHG